ncbi:class I SAM-dependent methyltransferase [Actinoplanes sp. CA-030573]|uniref:class I SAM-dependent methyltransferase n=1 Tax=Actinoplanes sp. CA-030573 TaxID=3239898 RepID=UPI003D8DAD63
MTTDLFDAGAMYDDDYLYFFTASDSAPTHGPLVGTAYADGTEIAGLVWRLLALEPGMTVLDVGCGHGVLANALAARGCQVTGLDSSAVFLDRARASSDVDFVLGDMRELPSSWTARFDRVVNWSTAFGYFDDPVNRAVLAEMARVLRPGGRLAMDLDNLTSYLPALTPSRVTARRPNGDMLVDVHDLDPLTMRLSVTRTVLRDGRARTLTFVKRLFAFPELRDWFETAGLTDVRGHGEDGGPLTAGSHRMVLAARRA